MPELIEQLQHALSDRYKIERELGQGGMATVYLAHDLKHDRKVAIKVLKPELAAVLGGERFLAEIKTTANLQHPHILALHDSGEVNGTVFYVMPFVEGESLRDRLTREKQLPIADAARIATEVAGALDYAHRHGVIHRDIKPENVLLHDGQALVADFGIALAASRAEGSTRLTETGMSLGTPHYMSPEQAMGERDISGRCDVYALGAMTYEMLVGEPPFTGPTAQAILAKVLTEEPVSPGARRKTVPPAMDRAVLTALQKLPADRFGTAADFAAALTATGPAGVALPAAQRASRSTASLVGGAIALLLLGMAAGRWLLAPATAPPPVWNQQSFHDEEIFNARLAPDGKTIVYSAASGRQPPQIYILRPDYPERTPLGLTDTHLLAVSPAGELAVLQHVEYLGHRLFRGVLARVPMGGGAPRALLDSVREADWLPDGNSLAVIRTIAGRDRIEAPVGTVLFEASGYLSDPRVAPDGDHVAFAEHPFRWDDRGHVRIVDRAGKVVATSGEFASIEGLAWRPGGTEVVFGGTAGRTMTIHTLTLAGSEREVLSGAGDLTLHDVAPSGQLLLSQDASPLRVKLRTPRTAGEDDASWLNYSQDATLARDGALLSIGDGSSEINYSVLLRRTDGGAWARLGEGQPAAFSPDDRWILAVVPATPPRITLYPTGTGAERPIDVGAFESLGSADWFPDAAHVLFCGNRSGEAARCYTVPLAGGAPRAVTPPGTANGHVSPDGRQVVAYSESGWERYPVDGGTGQPVAGLTGDDRVARWSADGRALYVWRNTSSVVDRLDLGTGRRSPLFTVGADQGGGFTTLNYVTVADDPRVYAYVYQPYISKLFTVDGVR